MQKRNVLRCQKDFDAVYKGGRSRASKYVVVFYKENGLGHNRISFLASKKVGNSVRRNRARRLMKEAFRNLGRDLPEGFDLIIIARKGIESAGMSDVLQSLEAAIKNTGVF